MKSSISQLTYAELMAEIYRLSSDKCSGTVFITSHDGHLARIVLDEGRITHLVFDSKYRGYDVIPLIQAIKFARLQFVEGVFETAEEVPLPSTDKIFQTLGETHTKNGTSPPFSNVDMAIEQIKKGLATHIGPIATLVCEEYTEKVGPLNTKSDVFAMIDSVAQEIQKPDEEKAFKEQMKTEILKI